MSQLARQIESVMNVLFPIFQEAVGLDNKKTIRVETSSSDYFNGDRSLYRKAIFKACEQLQVKMNIPDGKEFEEFPYIGSVLEHIWRYKYQNQGLFDTLGGDNNDSSSSKKKYNEFKP